MKRLAHTQVWPVLRYLLWMAPVTAASRSASSSTRNGALPPSSSATFFTVPAHCAMSSLPTARRARERQLAHLVVAGELAADGDRIAGDHVEHARGNAGALRELRHGQRRVGRLRRGLARRTCSPRRAPAPALRVIMAAGKFHGVIAATTPIGWRSTMMRLSAWCPGMMSP